MDLTTFRFFMASAAGAEPEPVIGEPYQGGYFVGYISYNEDGVATHGLVVADKAAEVTDKLMYSATTVDAYDKADGQANTNAMLAMGGPAANYCNGYSNDGFDDWYLPAKNELEIAYYNLKPSTDLNVTNSGINPNAVPPRNSNYSSLVPSQTAALLFQTGKDQAFAIDSTNYRYWTSTSLAGSGDAKGIRFSDGRAVDNGRTLERRVRPFRKFAV